MNIPRKAWIHKSGAMVPIPEDDFIPEDHGVFAVKNPEKFGMTHEQMKSAVGDDKEYTRMKENRGAWSVSVNRAMNNLGWMRLIRSTTRYSDGFKHHDVTISHESNKAHPHDFIEPLRVLKPYLEVLPDNESFGIGLSGFDSSKTHRDDHLRQSGLSVPQQDQVAFGDLNKVNKYIGESGGKRSREPEKAASVPSSADIRSAIGPKPQHMSTAEFNFYRSIGDSYTPCKFNTLLERIGNNKNLINESGGKRILGANPIQLTHGGLLRHLRKWSDHISIVEGTPHTQIRDSTGNLIHTISNSSKLGPKAAIDALTKVRNHLVKSGAYTPPKGESTGNLSRRQNITVEEGPKSAIPVKTPEQLSQKASLLRDVLSRQLGAKKRERVQAALNRTERTIQAT